MTRSVATKRSARLCVGLLAAIFLPRAYLAVADQGMVWSDEIFQTLEQGHRLVFGYGFVPWEFKTGARSWLLPGAVGAIMKLLAVVGISRGLFLAIGLKLFFAALSVATFHPLLRMARAWGGLSAEISLALVAACFPASLLYSSRVMAEVASVPFLTWGLWLLWPHGLGHGRAVARTRIRSCRGRWVRLLGAGALLGLSAILRYQNGILLPVLALLVLLRAGLRPALWLTLGATVLVLLGGALDWLTWGKPFQSFIEYMRFNLMENGANQWGVSQRGFYLRTMLASNGSLLLVLLVGFVSGLRKTWPVALLVLLFLAVHSAIAHKELRFMVPAIPLFLLCSAVGWARLLDRLPHPRSARTRVTWALAAIALLVFSLRTGGVTFADIGQHMEPAKLGGPTSPLVLGAFDEKNRLLAQAGTHVDLCGLAAPGMNPYWTGGYAYFHRRVPMLWSSDRGDLDAANYALIGPGQTLTDGRFKPISKMGAYQLYRRDGACRPPPRGSGGYGRLSPSGVPGL